MQDLPLSDIDDLPFHQAPTPFNVLATSDPHFNDGCYFATYAEDWYVSLGMRLHPNTNTVDGFVNIARGGEQRAWRFTRALRPEHATLAIGPFRLSFPERMKQARFELEETGGLALDLRFDSVGPPYVEAPYRHYRYGRLINDLVRYTMICRASGHLELDGQRTNVERWHGLRDHSWGIRASMGPRDRSGGVSEEKHSSDARRFRVWVPFEIEGQSGFFHTHEAEDGSALDFEGVIDWADGRRTELVGVEHRIEYHPGTHNPRGGSYTLKTADGQRLEYRIERAGTAADVQGGGYYGGWHDGERTGIYRSAAPKIEQDRYPAPADGVKTGPLHVPEKKRMGQTEFPCWLVGPGGARGMAHFEHHIFGAYKPYGFA